MAQDTLISVIVPVYKVEPYLKRCIDSILAQTHTELEIILVDDGSPDGCGAICDAYAQRDTRVRVLHKENGGLSSARNAGIDRAKGAYIAFVDSDDFLSEEMIENLYRGLMRHNADICISGHYTERDGKLLIEEPPIDADRSYMAREALLELIRDVHIKSYAWDKLYKAELFEGVRYPERQIYEDIATTYKLFGKARVVCQVPGYHYYYQIRSDSISSTQSDEKWMANCRDMLTAMRERLAWFEEKGDGELAAEAMARLIPYAITLLNLQYRLVKRRKDPAQWRQMETLKAFLSQRKSDI